MSRSRRKYPIIRDVGYMKSIYWRVIRRIWKHEIQSNKEVLSNPKELINDYDYCDWIYDCKNTFYEEKAYRK